MTHVPYKGTPPAMNDLLGGNIQVLFGDSTTLLPAIRAGTVRALAVSTATRSEAAPEIPTMAEAGVPGFESASWQMLVAPGGTPPEVISLLNREVRAIFSDPSVTRELSHRGVGPRVTGSPEQLRKFVQDEIVRWSDIVRRAGVAGRL
jgi:tripartite-type tricarboxylate transporter receptor subunit TctC